MINIIIYLIIRINIGCKNLNNLQCCLHNILSATLKAALILWSWFVLLNRYLTKCWISETDLFLYISSKMKNQC